MALDLNKQANVLQSALNALYTSRGSDAQVGLGDFLAAIVNQPSNIIDIPSLTGAQILALPPQPVGTMYTNSDTNTLLYFNGADWIELL